MILALYAYGNKLLFDISYNLAHIYIYIYKYNSSSKCIVYTKFKWILFPKFSTFILIRK